MLKNLKIISMLVITLFLVLSFGGCDIFDMSTKSVFRTLKSLIEQKHAGSGHADSSAEAFVHWDEDDPAEISTRCAKCHSTKGYLDFLGADGSTAFQVDAAVPAGPGEDIYIKCEACHTDSETGAIRGLAHVTMPSGVTIEGLGSEALCMQCHQGRSSGPSVKAGLAGKALDTPSSSIRFSNIHYYPASASLFGSEAHGGLEYDGKTYDYRFAHVTGYNACIDCHDPHTLKVKEENCRTCHEFNSLQDIRYYGSFTDYDGDGDISEGIYHEIADVKKMLYETMKRYSVKVVGTGIVYESHSYPYFFTDTNGNGVADASEANYGNSYKSFTPRLLKAAYNFQFASKDPGIFAHGGKYILQLLYDGIEDMNKALKGNTLYWTNGLHRGDEGHFDGSTEAWRHWDEDGEVAGRCARCHTATGLATYLSTGENADPEPVSNGMLCTTCHTSPPGLLPTGPVEFPSGIYADLGDSSNLCMNCHQGRAWRGSVESKISGGAAPYSFTNIHYFPAAAVFFGTEVQGGFEFAGKTYSGKKMYPNHNGQFDTCVECHMGTSSGIQKMTNHNVYKPNPADCVNCHGRDVAQPKPGADPKLFKFSGIRPASTPDYDRDGDRTESIKDEIKGLEAALYAQLQVSSKAIGKPLIYDSHAYPYFFNDNNGNGMSDPGEAIYPNAYRFSAKLLKAAYNYQLSKKEPHGFIHNSRYVAQLLVDSIGSLGGNVAPYHWR